MTDFRLPKPVDAAICMQDSQGHLLETEALLAHLRAVRRNVRRGGVFIFDRLVPNGWNPGARWTWTRRRRGITVRTSFQTLLDYDVARQVCREVMRFDITEKGRTRSVVQQAPDPHRVPAGAARARRDGREAGSSAAGSRTSA